MSLTVTTRSDLETHLRSLGLEAGMDVVVHSRLMAFGHLPDGVEGVYKALRVVLGEASTIAVPTYRLHTSGREGFDPARSSSERCGVLAEYIRQLPGAVRSKCPMHSHAAVGPKAKVFLEPTGQFSMGPGSDFEVIHRERFVTVLLGCNFPESATFITHVMAIHGSIPYRSWMSLERPILRPDDLLEAAWCQYYGRVSRSDDVEDWDIARDLLRSRGRLREAKCAYGSSYAFEPQDMLEILGDHLSQRPDGLLVGNR